MSASGSQELLPGSSTTDLSGSSTAGLPSYQQAMNSLPLPDDGEPISEEAAPVYESLPDNHLPKYEDVVTNIANDNHDMHIDVT